MNGIHVENLTDEYVNNEEDIAQILIKVLILNAPDVILVLLHISFTVQDQDGNSYQFKAA